MTETRQTPIILKNLQWVGLSISKHISHISRDSPGQCHLRTKKLIWQKRRNQWRIQDFPEVRVPNPPGGANIRFCQIFPKTAWNWKNLDHGRGRASLATPLDPPMVTLSLCDIPLLHTCKFKHLPHSCTPHSTVHAKCFTGIPWANTNGYSIWVPPFCELGNEDVSECYTDKCRGIPIRTTKNLYSLLIN